MDVLGRVGRALFVISCWKVPMAPSDMGSVRLGCSDISRPGAPRELGVFDWLTHVQASPLAYLAVLGACALDAVLPIVPSEAW